MHTPFIPAFRSRLAALGCRTTQTLRQTPLAQFQQHLRDFLPPPLLSAADEGPNSRDRIFSLRLTFECFVWQMLQPQTSCREVVRQVQALSRLSGCGPVDEGDSAYVQARHRLPRERLEKALAATAQAAGGRAGQAVALQGRPVKVVDGSTAQLADTPENQARFPQPSTQKAGCGFPVLKLAVLFCLNSGAVLNVIWGRNRPVAAINCDTFFSPLPTAKINLSRLTSPNARKRAASSNGSFGHVLKWNRFWREDVIHKLRLAALMGKYNDVVKSTWPTSSLPKYPMPSWWAVPKRATWMLSRR